MRGLASNIYYCFVSPEFVVVCVGLFLMQLEPIWLDQISAQLKISTDGIKYLSLLPAVIFTWCITKSKIILFPSEDEKKLLSVWPKFNHLKFRIVIGLGYQLIFAIVGVIFWLFLSDNTFEKIEIILNATVIIGSFVGAITFYLADVTIASITKKYSTNEE